MHSLFELTNLSVEGSGLRCAPGEQCLPHRQKRDRRGVRGEISVRQAALTVLRRDLVTPGALVSAMGRGASSVTVGMMRNDAMLMLAEQVMERQVNHRGELEAEEPNRDAEQRELAWISLCGHAAHQRTRLPIDPRTVNGGGARGSSARAKGCWR